MDKQSKSTTQRPTSWFWKWFLNNQVVTALLVVLLLLLIIFTFTKVAYLFEPVGQFLSVVGLPIVLSGILYYLMNPAVDFLEKKGVKRLYSILLLFVVVIGLIVWGVVVIIPEIRDQTVSFIDNFPSYMTAAEKGIDEVFSDPIFKQFQEQVASSSEKLISSITDVAKNVSKSTFQNIGNFFGAVATITVAIITMPFILFYLLKDGKKLPGYLVKFLPTKFRQPTLVVLKEMNDQVSSYIRGQLTVAFLVAVIFMILFSIIGLDYAITLGIVAGALNLIPYLGSFLAMVPAVFLGIVGGPILLVKVLIVFVVEQTIEGRLISPLVLGSQLSIHPVTILFVLLTSGKLFGLAGVILGIPVYAAAKVVITHIFEWYKTVSNLYEEEQMEERKIE
ncbi:AI-2E family transporter [uncultured Enterococcus sp.]|uniref:AI-2E family transporter n=1 Tax=uncultured Enterococcus sp. TaxID=167972 RepID=UPI0025D3749C|nr:AI-2E family transporter [uncultured Enterococcus sp.]